MIYPPVEYNRSPSNSESHVNMGVNPSGQDDAQMEDFRANGCDWFIRGIFNKKGEAKFWVYYYFMSGFVIDDVSWSVDYDLEDPFKEFIATEVKTKVSRLQEGVTLVKHTTYPGYKGGVYKGNQVWDQLGIREGYEYLFSDRLSVD